MVFSLICLFFIAVNFYLVSDCKCMDLLVRCITSVSHISLGRYHLCFGCLNILWIGHLWCVCVCVTVCCEWVGMWTSVGGKSGLRTGGRGWWASDRGRWKGFVCSISGGCLQCFGVFTRKAVHGKWLKMSNVFVNVPFCFYPVFSVFRGCFGFIWAVFIRFSGGVYLRCTFVVSSLSLR